MEIATKACSECGEVKPLTEFCKNKYMKLGVKSSWKECELVRNKAYVANNKGLINAYHKQRYANNPSFALVKRLRSRLNQALAKATKSAPTLKLLGMELSYFVR